MKSTAERRRPGRPRRTDMTPEERRKAQQIRNNEYILRTHRIINFRLHSVIDADIIAHLESQPSMAGYIKTLIRRDMEASK